jgi:hypothetical protein
VVASRRSQRSDHATASAATPSTLSIVIQSLNGLQEDTLTAPPSHSSVRYAALAGLLLLTATDIAPAHEGHRHGVAATAAEHPFLVENEAAMARMMQAMAVQPSGDVDRDFVAMMTAHHQGAIDMAVALLRHGSNRQLRRLAQEIIITQRDEIAAMRMAIDAPLPPAAPVPAQVTPGATSPAR